MLESKINTIYETVFSSCKKPWEMLNVGSKNPRDWIRFLNMNDYILPSNYSRNEIPQKRDALGTYHNKMEVLRSLMNLISPQTLPLPPLFSATGLSIAIDNITSIIPEYYKWNKTNQNSGEKIRKIFIENVGEAMNDMIFEDSDGLLCLNSLNNEQGNSHVIDDDPTFWDLQKRRKGYRLEENSLFLIQLMQDIPTRIFLLLDNQESVKSRALEYCQEDKFFLLYSTVMSLLTDYFTHEDSNERNSFLETASTISQVMKGYSEKSFIGEQMSLNLLQIINCIKSGPLNQATKKIMEQSFGLNNIEHIKGITFPKNSLPITTRTNLELLQELDRQVLYRLYSHGEIDVIKRFFDDTTNINKPFDMMFFLSRAKSVDTLLKKVGKNTPTLNPSTGKSLSQEEVVENLKLAFEILEKITNVNSIYFNPEAIPSDVYGMTAYMRKDQVDEMLENSNFFGNNIVYDASNASVVVIFPDGESLEGSALIPVKTYPDAPETQKRSTIPLSTSFEKTFFTSRTSFEQYIHQKFSTNLWENFKNGKCYMSIVLPVQVCLNDGSTVDVELRIIPEDLKEGAQKSRNNYQKL